MKIIFKSKEEKDKILDSLAKTAVCPNDLGLRVLDNCNCTVGDLCRKCWESSGIETEVKDEGSERDLTSERRPI